MDCDVNVRNTQIIMNLCTPFKIIFRRLFVFNNYNKRTKLVCALRVVLCCLLSSSIHARTFSEYDIKAVFLYNFVDFATWPDDGENKIKQICVFGDNPFDTALKDLANVDAKNNTVEIHYTRDLKEILDCHILFISQSEKNHVPKIINMVNHSPVLLVSDIKDFASRQGMIGFVLHANKIRLEINLVLINASGIKLSSSLIELSTIVDSDKTLDKKNEICAININ